MSSRGLPPFERVVEEYGDDVWRFSVSQVGRDRADDVFQETMLAALAAFPSLRDPSAVRPWLLRIAARKAVDLFRARARAAVPVAELDPGAQPEAQPLDDELWARVRALPSKQRQAVALRFVLDLEHSEVAAAMDTSTEAARRNVFEGLRALRRLMTGGDMPDDAAAIEERVAALPWPDLRATLHTQGFAQSPTVLLPQECLELAELYEAGRFRSTIDMARHRFGAGTYKYFDYPLPDVIRELRTAFYPPLARVANEWAELLAEDERYPDELDQFLEQCHRAGQTRPTPLIFRYGPGDWNALHQDLYGDIAFPFQIVTVLSRPGHDFEGGEVVLVEQRPRAQSRAHVEQLRQGAFLIFTTRHRPARGTRGPYRAPMRHGVSTLTAGTRTTLGIIFHDAR